MPRRDATPVTVQLAVLQELRWGRTTASALTAAVALQTRGLVRMHVGLVYRALHQLTALRYARRSTEPGRVAGFYELTAKGAAFAHREADAVRGLFPEKS